MSETQITLGEPLVDDQQKVLAEVVKMFIAATPPGGRSH